MASIKYGCLNPNAKTKEYPVAASQYFAHEGFNPVLLDGSGNLIGGLTASGTLLGVAIVPKGRGNATNTSDSYWLSSATAAKDKIPVVLGVDGEQFLAPTGTSAQADTTVAAATHVGNAYNVTGANTATSHWVDLGETDIGNVIIMDLGVNVHTDAAVTDAVVIINPILCQAD